MWKKQILERAVDMIKGIELKAEEADLLEDCEAITSIIIPEVMGMILDSDIKETIQWLNKAHGNIHGERWKNIADYTCRIFREAGGTERVKIYHELEQVCNELEEKDLSNVKDEKIRETIKTVKHIHENMLQRMVNLLQKFYQE